MRHPERMTRRVLMIGYHYPPMQGSSGILRMLKYSQYLPRFGWWPIVLTVHPRAYARSSDDQMASIPQGVIVKRAFAMDSAIHLSVRGRYPSLLEVPDRWISWLLGAVPAGMALIRRYRPQAIWSTYPIATAHLVGLALRRLSGLPWIADFRDPMAQEGYPANERRWRAYRWIEAQALEHASQCLFTTSGTMEMYAARYPNIPRSRLRLNENGYDEESFGAESVSGVRLNAGRLMFLHSGIVYPSERDPTALFGALADLLGKGSISPDTVEFVFRASGHDEHLRELLEKFGISSIVRLEPPVSYRAALAEMLAADALVVLQASNCNAQVPAKLYEYFRARRPILGLTDPIGDTADTMRRAGIDTIVNLASREDIALMLPRFIDRVRSGTAPRASDAAVQTTSRLARAQELAEVLDELTAALPAKCLPTV